MIEKNVLIISESNTRRFSLRVVLPLPLSLQLKFPSSSFSFILLFSVCIRILYSLFL